jgi:hypothetical protein
MAGIQLMVRTQLRLLQNSPKLFGAQSLLLYGKILPFSGLDSAEN